MAQAGMSSSTGPWRRLGRCSFPQKVAAPLNRPRVYEDSLEIAKGFGDLTSYCASDAAPGSPGLAER